MLFSPAWPSALQLPGMRCPDTARLAAAWDEVLEEARLRRRQQQQQAAQEEAEEGRPGQVQQQAQARMNAPSQQSVPVLATAGGAMAVADGWQPAAAGPGPSPGSCGASAPRQAEPLRAERSVAHVIHQPPRPAAQVGMHAAPARTTRTASPQLQPHHAQQQQQQVTRASPDQPPQPPNQQIQPQSVPLGLSLLQQAHFLQQQQALIQQHQYLQYLLQHPRQQRAAFPGPAAPQQAAVAAQAPPPPRQQQQAVYAAGGAVPQIAVGAQQQPQQQQPLQQPQQPAAAMPAEVLGAADDAQGDGQAVVPILVRGWREVGPESSGQHRTCAMLYEYEGLQLDTTYSVDSDQVPLLELAVDEPRELALHTVACSAASQLRAVGIPPPQQVERALLGPATTTPQHLAWLVEQLKAYSRRAGQIVAPTRQPPPPPPPPPPAPPPPPPAARQPAGTAAHTAAQRDPAQGGRQQHVVQQQQQQQRLQGLQQQQLQQLQYRQQRAFGHAHAWAAAGGVQGGGLQGTWSGQAAAAAPAAAQWAVPVPGPTPHAAAAAAAATAAAAAMGQQYYAHVAAQAAAAANMLPQPPAAGATVNTLGDVWDIIGA